MTGSTSLAARHRERLQVVLMDQYQLSFSSDVGQSRTDGRPSRPVSGRCRLIPHLQTVVISKPSTVHYTLNYDEKNINEDHSACGGTEYGHATSQAHEGERFFVSDRKKASIQRRCVVILSYPSFVVQDRHMRCMMPCACRCRTHDVPHDDCWNQTNTQYIHGRDR